MSAHWLKSPIIETHSFWYTGHTRVVIKREHDSKYNLLDYGNNGIPLLCEASLKPWQTNRVGILLYTSHCSWRIHKSGGGNYKRATENNRLPGCDWDTVSFLTCSVADSTTQHQSKSGQSNWLYQQNRKEHRANNSDGKTKRYW